MRTRDDEFLADAQLDDLTARRLVVFARRVGLPVGAAAAALLRDLLGDEDFWDAAEDPVGADGSLVPDRVN